MSVEQIVKGIVETQMLNLAERIEGDLKAEVAPHSKSGLAVGAIHIEKRSTDNIFIGGTDGTGTGKTGTDHLAMLNDGNGTKIIYPVRAKALRYTDGSLHGRSTPYKGIHFVEKVASRYR